MSRRSKEVSSPRTEERRLRKSSGSNSSRIVSSGSGARLVSSGSGARLAAESRPPGEREATPGLYDNYDVRPKTKSSRRPLPINDDYLQRSISDPSHDATNSLSDRLESLRLEHEEEQNKLQEEQEAEDDRRRQRRQRRRDRRLLQKQYSESQLEQRRRQDSTDTEDLPTARSSSTSRRDGGGAGPAGRRKFSWPSRRLIELLSPKQNGSAGMSSGGGSGSGAANNKTPHGAIKGMWKKAFRRVKSKDSDSGDGRERDRERSDSRSASTRSDHRDRSDARAASMRSESGRGERDDKADGISRSSRGSSRQASLKKVLKRRDSKEHTPPDSEVSTPIDESGSASDMDPIFSTLRHAATMRRPHSNSVSDSGGEKDRFDAISEEGSVNSIVHVTSGYRGNPSASYPGYSTDQQQGLHETDPYQGHREGTNSHGYLRRGTSAYD